MAMTVRGALLALLMGWATAAGSQAATSPVRLEAERYRFDLERNFFASPETEVAERPVLVREAAALRALASRIETPADLLAAFEADDRVQRRFRRHDLYLFLRFATDISREDGLRDADALRGTVRASRQALRRAVIARDDAWIAAALREQSGLARYAFFIATIRREAPHLLGSEQQGVVSALEPLLGAGDYPRIVNGLRFGTVEAEGRALDAGSDRAEIGASPSPQVRREGSRLLFAGYGAQRDLFAHLLVRTIAGSNALARLRGHASAEAEAAFDAYVTPEHYADLLAAVARHGDSYKQWQARAADPLAVALGWGPGEAAAAIVASAAALGPAYAREYAELLDPANGRADLAGGDRRLPMMGTASVYPTGRSAIYMQAFGGSLLELVVLAHEGGHAVQAQLMHRHGVPIAYAAGPGYFTESFGRFQELLLLDHLDRAARVPRDRTRLRDALAARLMSVFPSAEEAAVELAIHRGVSEGRIRTADDLDAATEAAGATYSIDYQRTPERRGLWMLSEGYFMAPMQELNDAYASLLAIRYFQLWRRDPARFRAGYLALLSGGYDDEPGDLLRRHLDIDMIAPGFVAETMAALQAEVAALYR
jgi:oligoendopeptidase F